MKKLAIFGGKPLLPEIHRKSKFGAEENIAINNVLKKGILSQFRGGNEVHVFEMEFARYIGCEYALTTTSGTTALHTALATCGFPKDSEILVPAVTFVSTASIVLQERLKPVFVDIDDYYCMDIEDLSRKITSKSRAIIPVHLYGHPADMSSINTIAKENGLIVIEDACQSHGASYKGKKTGNLGNVGCFSFYQTKNMTCGEGGMITFSDPSYYDQLRLVRENGSPYQSSTWYSYKKLGYNYNMTEMQAAIGRIQLQKLEKNNEHRRKISAIYDYNLKDLPLQLPKTAKDVVHARHNYPILLPSSFKQKRDFFVAALKMEGVPIDIAYPCTLYQTDLFSGDAFNKDCKNAEDITSRLFTLFTDEAISDDIAQMSCLAIHKVFNWLQDNE